MGEGEVTFDQFPGGAANLTYRAVAGDVELVIRRAPLGPVAAAGHDMAREYRVLSRLWSAYPLAPRAFHYCDDPDVIGKPFVVMERRRGWVIRDRWPPGYDDRASQRRLAVNLVAALADLHRVDPGAVGLGELGRPDGFVTRQIEGWAGRWEAAATRSVPDMHVAAELPAVGRSGAAGRRRAPQRLQAGQHHGRRRGRPGGGARLGHGDAG